MLKTFFNDKNFLTLRLQTNAQQQCLIEIEGNLKNVIIVIVCHALSIAQEKQVATVTLHKVCLPGHIMWHRWQDRLDLFLHSCNRHCFLF